MKLTKTLTIIALLFFIAGCATVPFTNRKALMLVSPEEEMALGDEAFKQVLKESKMSNDSQAIERIKSIGKRIAQVANKPEYKWDFVLIEASKTVNAFCLPGGKVAFYTGILPICQDDDGIAVVMGHEIAHAIARHGAERMSQGQFVNLAGNVLSAAVANKTPEAKKLILNSYGLGAAVGVMLPFSRKHEYEADYIGLVLMAKAGFDPNKAVNFWQRMSDMSKGNQNLEFLSTHPSDDKRIEQMKTHLPEAMKYYIK